MLELFGKGFSYFITTSSLFMIIGLVLNIGMHKISVKDSIMGLFIEFFCIDVAVLYIIFSHMEEGRFLIWQLPIMLIALMVSKFIKVENIIKRLFSQTQTRIISILILLYAIAFVHLDIGANVINFLYPLIFMISELFVFGLIEKAVLRAKSRLEQEKEAKKEQESAAEQEIQTEAEKEQESRADVKDIDVTDINATIEKTQEDPTKIEIVEIKPETTSEDTDDINKN